MQKIHSELKKILPWYHQWHNHPRHKHTHWFGLFVFLLLTTSFISTEVVFLYSEKFEAQAQTALPAPNHPLAFGYYYSAGQYGNFINETGNYTNTDLIIAGSWIRGTPSCLRDTAGLDSAFRSAIAAGNRIVYFPIDPGPTQCPDGRSEYTLSVNVARNYWNNIDYLYPYDEPNWTRTETQNKITTLESALSASGLASKPIIVNYTPAQILNGTSYLASNIDIVGFEAYMPIDQQNSPSLVTNLNAQIDQLKARIGNRQMMIVIQGYGRNYCPTGSSNLCWSNIGSLKSIQVPAYLKAYNDPRVIGLFTFSYARLSGTKDLVENRNGQCIKTEHQRIWGAISRTTQPASIPCTSSATPTPTPGSGGGTPPTDIRTLMLSGGTFPDVMFYQGRVWVVYETAGRSLLRIESLNPDLSDRRVEKEISTGAGAGPFPRIASFNNTVWVSYRGGSPEDQRLWRMDTDTIESLGPAAGNNSSALGFGKIAYQNVTSQNFGVRMRDLTGGTPVDIRPGAPTGIARVTSPNTVVLIDEDRLAVPWGIEPWYAGALTVASAFQDNQGAVARFNDDPATQFSLWVGTPSSFNPHAATDGNGNYAVVTWGITTSGVRIATFTGPRSGSVTPSPVDATPGWRGSLAYNSTNNNWAVISERVSGSIIYARIMADNAQPVTNYFQVNNNSVSGLAPKIAYDPTRNRYLAVWIGFPVSGQPGEFYGQFIKADGSLEGQNFIIPRDYTGGGLFFPNSLLRYDRTNDKYAFVWENRPSGSIQVNFRTINGDGTAGPTIVTDQTSGILHGAPAMDMNPSADEACVAYQWHTNTSTYVNIAIQRININTGEVSPAQSLPSVRASGESNISYNSTNNTYLVSWTNSARNGVEGMILSSCSAASGGSIFPIGNFGAGISAYNPVSSTFGVVGQNWTGVGNQFVMLNPSGSVVDSRPIFTDGTNGNYAPVVAANSTRGTYGATSSRDYLMTRFISPLGAGSGVIPTPAPTPEPCSVGLVQPGVPIICDFSPTIARPGDTINVTGGSLSASVELFSSNGTRYAATGTSNPEGTNISFTIPSNVPEGDYTVSIMGSSGTTRTTSSQILNITLNINPDVTAAGEDFPFAAATGIDIPGATATFQDLIGSSLSYAVYALGIAVFVMIIYAGFLWMTAAANPSNIALAKRYMTNAVIGAVLLLSSYIILYTINPDLVGGRVDLEGIFQLTGTQSVIVQPTCDNGVCSNNSGTTCNQDTDCNVVCVNAVCNNGELGACTLDTDCQVTPRFIVDNEVQAASAFSAGCSRVSSIGFQDFTAVECPGSMPLTPDSILQLQDSATNQQIGATAIQSSGNNGAGRRIVILDTGYNYSHPELSSSYGGGKDFINNDTDPMDDHSSGTGSPGHGSHVAGIITADGVNGQAKGVAPQAQIIAGKVLDGRGQGQFSTIVSAIYWAVNGPDNVFGTADDFRPDAINLSVGGGTYANFCDDTDATSRDMAKAIQYAKDHGVLVVVAAGNNSSGVAMPGCINNAFTVGAIDSSNTITSFSGRGAGVDVVAPGSNIYSSLLGNSYGNKSGTSMASPAVAGLAALIKSAFPNYTVNQLERAITNTATDLGSPGKDTLYGWGRVSATAAGTGSSTGCSGQCGSLVATPASCTKGLSSSNPNCNITLSYTSSGVSPSSLSIRKNGGTLQNLVTANGAIADNNPAVGTYVYSLQNNTTNAIISSTTVHVYYTGTFTSPWLSCTKNSNPSNPNCDVALNYNIGGNVSGSATLYKNGVAWRTINLPAGSTVDVNPSQGVHTYTIRDSGGQIQIARLVISIESIPRSRIISSLSSYTAVIGDQITITGTNLGSQLELNRGYFTVQIHDKERVRHTTTGTLNPSNTSGTWTVNLGTGLQPGDYTLRVGPSLNLSDVSNEVRLTITTVAQPTGTPVTLCSGINYTGTCDTFSANDPDLSNNTMGNNNVRSVNLGSQSDIRLCDNINYGGPCESFFSNDPDLTNNTIGNNASSLGSY